METLQELREAVANKSAKILTIDIANELKGRKIATIYFGYREQDGIDEFIVGEIKPEIYANGAEGRICLFTADGRNTYIRAHEENNGAFTCSDSDRFVYFIEIEKIKLTRVFHQKHGGRVCDFLTNLSLEEVIAQNDFMQQPDRIVVKTETEFHYINDNPKCNESFVNGILSPEYLDKKPSYYNENRAWNEMYQKTTGNPLPKGGIL